MAIKTKKFHGKRFVVSVSDDRVLCFYDSCSELPVPHYIHCNGLIYSYSSMYLDSERHELLVSFEVSSLCAKDIVRLSKKLQAPFYIENLNFE